MGSFKAVKLRPDPGLPLSSLVKNPQRKLCMILQPRQQSGYKMLWKTNNAVRTLLELSGVM